MLKEVYNRHVLIELLEQEEKKEDKGFLLPEGYEKPKSPYAIGKVLRIAEDCNIKMICLDDTIVFDRTMLQEVNIKGRKIYLILENYILGGI